ncbi:ammonium transporter [Halococcus salifodinae DSM 8989]|uniref:Ammonium transporter n=1 Tax=Halococcus salifodinae DSM 8989 TaxID=1227456 RepID=M0MSA2_9EURY|nr:ammonium transporter [Halococcus salifodinae DSM 8989]
MIDILLQSGVDLEALASGVNNVWVLTVTFLIFFMHAGFAMLEAGQVRAKNVANQLTKNMLTWSIGVIVFFLLGQGIANITAGLTGTAGQTRRGQECARGGRCTVVNSHERFRPWESTSELGSARS